MNTPRITAPALAIQPKKMFPHFPERDADRHRGRISHHQEKKTLEQAPLTIRPFLGQLLRGQVRNSSRSRDRLALFGDSTGADIVCRVVREVAVGSPVGVHTAHRRRYR